MYCTCTVQKVITINNVSIDCKIDCLNCEMTTAELAHNVLKHIDSLKPLLLMTLDYVEYLYEIINQQKPPHITLNYYDILVNDLLQKVGSIDKSKAFDGIINKLQFMKPLIGQSIMFLDFITIICILSRGSIDQKARFLFKCYNFNETGLMEEVEHYNFIMRTCSCLKKIHILGSIDITSDIARYIAMEARTTYDNNEIKFMHGLRVENFMEWVYNNKECNVLFRMQEILHRLIDNLIVLESRVNGLVDIMEIKKAYKYDCIPVPNPEAITNLVVRSDIPIFITHRNRNIVSLCIPWRYIDHDIQEVYIKYDKILPYRQKHYSIVDYIIDRNRSQYEYNNNPLLSCCEKQIILTSYQRLMLHLSKRHTKYNIPLQRIDIRHLDESSIYNITVYTDYTQYRTVQVRTLMGINDNHRTDNYKEEQILLDRDIISVSILPACMSTIDADMFVKATTDIASSDMIVFTGSVVPIQQVLYV